MTEKQKIDIIAAMELLKKIPCEHAIGEGGFTHEEILREDNIDNVSALGQLAWLSLKEAMEASEMRCKWKNCKTKGYLKVGCNKWEEPINATPYCPWCGLKVEVVE